MSRNLKERIHRTNRRLKKSIDIICSLFTQIYARVISQKWT